MSTALVAALKVEDLVYPLGCQIRENISVGVPRVIGIQGSLDSIVIAGVITGKNWIRVQVGLIKFITYEKYISPPRIVYEI